MGKWRSQVESMGLMIKSFWTGKKVFITGHTGFKGSWLWLWLNDLGADVMGYSLEPNTSPSMFSSLHLDQIGQSVIADINDYETLRASLQKFQPEIVFHMAAQALVISSYENPRATYQTNVMGTVNLLEACRHIESVRTILNVTTDKVYENRESIRGYSESDPLGGYDPYSNSKACSEFVSNSYRDSFFKLSGKRLVTCRAGNVIGGGDWAAHRLIPDCARAYGESKKVIVRNPASIRPWQHVIEPLRFYLALAEQVHERNVHENSFNIGPYRDDVATVECILNWFTAGWENAKGWEQMAGSPVHHETARLVLNTELVENVLGWKPRILLREAVQLTADWYRKFYHNVSAAELRDLSLNQIRHVSRNQIAQFSFSSDSMKEIAL